jgi:hypothetical protein
MILCDVDKPWDCFRQEVIWTVAICYQVSSVSALDMGRVHHLPHDLLPEKKLIVFQKEINEFLGLRGGFKAVEIIKLCDVVP